MRRLAAAAAGVVALAAGAFVANETLLSESTCSATIAVGASWDAAYKSASLGDTLCVASGTHPAQTINYTAAKSSEVDEPDVTFRGTATVQGLKLNGARHLTFENLNLEGTVLVECSDTGVPTEAKGQHSVDMTFRGVRMGSFRLENAQRLLVANSEIGPSSTVIKVGASADDLGANCTDEPPSDITFVGNDIHNFREASAASHMECVFVEGVQGLVIRRNIVRGCSVFSIFFKQQLSAGLFGMQDIEVCNNFLGHPVASAYRSAGPTSISFSQGNYVNVRVCSNSLGGQLLLRTDLAGWSASNFAVEGNLGVERGGACSFPGLTWRLNAWEKTGSGGACPSDIAGGIPLDWVDRETSTEINSPTSDPLIDYHLAPGAWAIDKASTGQATDFDGQARPMGAAFDVGADEVGGDDPPPTTTEPPPTTTEPPPTTTEPPPTTTEPPPPLCPGSSLALTVLAQDASSITLGWTPPANAAGYRFSRSDQTKRTHTWDPARSSVKFGKGAECYLVEALSVSSSGGHPR